MLISVGPCAGCRCLRQKKTVSVEDLVKTLSLLLSCQKHSCQQIIQLQLKNVNICFVELNTLCFFSYLLLFLFLTSKFVPKR